MLLHRFPLLHKKLWRKSVDSWRAGILLGKSRRQRISAMRKVIQENALRNPSDARLSLRGFAGPDDFIEGLMVFGAR